MFIVDQSDRGNAKIRYVNKTAATVRVAGVNVATESIQTLFVESGTPHLYGAAAFGNQFCYSSGSTNGLSGNHNVICRNRSDDLAPLTMRAGSGGISPATSGGPLNTEQEGQPPNDIRLNKPSGLAFDASGNLYIVEYGNSLIRRVKRWFP
jgi:hypothetical protein